MKYIYRAIKHLKDELRDDTLKYELLTQLEGGLQSLELFLQRWWRARTFWDKFGGLVMLCLVPTYFFYIQIILCFLWQWSFKLWFYYNFSRLSWWFWKGFIWKRFKNISPKQVAWDFCCFLKGWWLRRTLQDVFLTIILLIILFAEYQLLKILVMPFCVQTVWLLVGYKVLRFSCRAFYFIIWKRWQKIKVWRRILRSIIFFKKINFFYCQWWATRIDILDEAVFLLLIIPSVAGIFHFLYVNLLHSWHAFIITYWCFSRVIKKKYKRYRLRHKYITWSDFTVRKETPWSAFEQRLENRYGIWFENGRQRPYSFLLLPCWGWWKGVEYQRLIDIGETILILERLSSIRLDYRPSLPIPAKGYQIFIGFADGLTLVLRNPSGKNEHWYQAVLLPSNQIKPQVAPGAFKIEPWEIRKQKKIGKILKRTSL